MQTEQAEHGLDNKESKKRQTRERAMWDSEDRALRKREREGKVNQKRSRNVLLFTAFVVGLVQ